MSKSVISVCTPKIWSCALVNYKFVLMCSAFLLWSCWLCQERYRNHDKSTTKYLQKGIQKQRSERRQAWIQALHRKDLTDVKLKYPKICSDHFITVSPEISSVIRPVLFGTQVYNITLPVCLS
jgi:hypothetical protein